MLGNPKYKYGEEVLFDLDGRSLKGRIYIVDAYGTFFDNSDVSYDIMVEESPHFNNTRCLYKHINEKFVRKDDENETDWFWKKR